MTVCVCFETALGRIVADIFTEKAPVTAGNFLRHVDEGFYQGATFYRAARYDNDVREPKITVIQGGIDPTSRDMRPLPPIAHESTEQTGVRHLDGTLSMARWEVGSAGSEFFIVIGDSPQLDFGGARNPDKQGFAAFGRVVEGMNVVRQINASQTGNPPATIEILNNQMLMPPLAVRIARLS